MEKRNKNMLSWVKKLYIYLFSAIGLVILIIGAVQLIDLGLRAWVFTKADTYLRYPLEKPVPTTDREVDEDGEEVGQISEEELEEFNKAEITSQRQRRLSNSISLIIVGLPLFLYHWRLARGLEG